MPDSPVSLQVPQILHVMSLPRYSSNDFISKPRRMTGTTMSLPRYSPNDFISKPKRMTGTTISHVPSSSTSISHELPSSSTSNVGVPKKKKKISIDRTAASKKKNLSLSSSCSVLPGSLKPLNNVCKICYDNEGQVVLLQCGHMGICLQCSELFMRKPCPFCRKKVTKISKVFFN